MKPFNKSIMTIGNVASQASPATTMQQTFTVRRLSPYISHRERGVNTEQMENFMIIPLDRSLAKTYWRKIWRTIRSWERRVKSHE